MKTLTANTKSDQANMFFGIGQRILSLRIRILMKTIITVLISFGFISTDMDTSDIYFTLASLIWLWQQPLEKIELSILNRAINVVNKKS